MRPIGIFVAAALAWGFIAFSIHDHLGRGGTAGWEYYLLGNATRLTPAATALAAGLSAAIVLVVAALRRQILLYCFDPTLAEVTGVPGRVCPLSADFSAVAGDHRGDAAGGESAGSRVAGAARRGGFGGEPKHPNRHGGRHRIQHRRHACGHCRVTALAVYCPGTGDCRRFIPGISGGVSGARTGRDGKLAGWSC